MPTRLRARAVRAILTGGFALALVAGLAGCAPLGPGATLRVLAGESTVSGAVAGDGTRVDPGDLIEVSGSGAIVELQWPDGSFTRLGEGTRFVVGASGARGTLETGTAWNSLVPGSTFAIATSDGSARGGAGSVFALSCAAECRGVVAEGAVTLEDGESASAPATFLLGSGDVQPAGWDAIYADPFALANSERDEAAGLPQTTAAWAAQDPALGSLGGVFEGPASAGAQSCTGWAEECARVQANIFGAPPSDYAFSISCDGTLPCATDLEVTINGADGSKRTAVFPLAFDGTVYTSSTTFGDGTYCTFPDGRTEGTWTNGGTLTVTPTDAEVRDGAFVVTAVSIASENWLRMVEATTDPSCAEFEYEWSSSKSRAMTLTGAAADAPDPLAVDAGADDPRPVSGPARPSVLSGLKSPVDAIPTIEQWALIGATILVCVLVLAFPGYLLSRVVSDRLEASVERRAARHPARRVPNGFLRFLSVVFGLIVASVITAAVDPSFGAPLVASFANPGDLGSAFSAIALDLAGWRLVGTAFAAFVVFVLLGALVVRIASRRIAPGATMHLQFRWASVLVLIAGVVVSRLFDLSPGIIFGLVAGWVIVDSLPVAARGRLALVGAVFALIVGAAAWAGYAIFATLAAAAPGDLVLVTASELLSALTIEAVSTLPLALLPFAALDGGVLRRWRLPAWIVVYALALALFILVMVAVPGSWVEVQGDAIVWLIGFGTFTVLALSIWGVHAALQRRRTARVAPEAPME
ncbi:MAG: hypothetical protein KF727_13235 [Microbacteriaceae bacterium]|nr:hypothetical protein [Microbacteriaceae bacterium]